MNRLITIAFCLLLSTFCLAPCSAQTETDPPLPRSMQKETPLKKQRPKFVAGGGLGISFSGYGGAVGVMPQVGVYVKPWLLALVNGQYTYVWSRNFYESHTWGLGAALQPIIIKKIIVHVGYDFEQYRFNWRDGSPVQVANFHYLTLGAGYKYYMSQRIFFQALVLMNIPLNQPAINNYSHSYYPFFRFGVGVDL